MLRSRSGRSAAGERRTLTGRLLTIPPGDPLYGMEPDTSEDYGIKLGAMDARGALIVSLGALMRTSSNPFFTCMMARIEQGIPGR